MNEALKALEEYWKERPYLRLGQIVYNAWHKQKKSESSDVFYMADADFIKAIEDLKLSEKYDK